MKVEIKGKKIILTLDMFETPQPSSTGKMNFVARTERGWETSEVKIGGKAVKANVMVGIDAA